MTQENKELLIKDLCTRLPYGVKVPVKEDYAYDGKIISGMTKGGLVYINPFSYKIKDIKPYLFPISSITDEQIEYCQKLDIAGKVDWLNAHHFDYRGLIDKGLAINATNLNIY